MRSQSHPIRQSLFGGIFLTLGGCANTGAPSTDSDIEGGWFDGTSRTVAVVPTDGPTPAIKLYFLESPETERARIAKAAGSAALECLDAMSGGAGGIAGGIAVLITLGCMPIAAGVGASKASGGTSTKGLDRVPDDVILPNGLRERFEQSLKGRGPELLVSQKVVSLMQARADHDVHLEPYGNRAEELVRKGQLNAMLEIQVRVFGFVIDRQFDESLEDPGVALLVILSATSYSLSEELLFPGKQGSLRYLGETRRFSEFVSENGRLLDQEIERGTSMLAELIVK